MWQRIQTIFLSIAAIASFSILFLPLAELNGVQLTGKGDVLVTVISIAILLITLFNITQYRDRKLQLRLCLITILLSLGLLVVCYFEAQNYSENVNYLVIAVVPAVSFFATILARRNIRKDDKLVKSMDRFR